MTTAISPLQQITYYSYDTFGNCISIQNALEQTTYLEYNSSGKATSIKDARENTSYFVYDKRDRLIQRKNALGYTHEIGYDSRDKVTVLDTYIHEAQHNPSQRWGGHGWKQKKISESLLFLTQKRFQSQKTEEEEKNFNDILVKIDDWQNRTAQEKKNEGWDDAIQFGVSTTIDMLKDIPISTHAQCELYPCPNQCLMSPPNNLWEQILHDCGIRY